MERVCPKCGTLISGEGMFCPECGTAIESVVDLNKPQSSEPVQPVPTSIPQSSEPTQPVPTSIPVQNTVPMQNNVQPAGYPNAMPQYQQNFNNAPAPEIQEKMSVGAWVGTVILTSWFGLISLIILFVWAFGNTPQPKKNYCRAMLIFQLIAIVLCIALAIVIMCLIGWNFNAFTEFFENLGENFQYSFDL